ncbi:hypothetical protein KL925_004923 [Ogataea polymorpha]|nr:hypothetical protein KL936_004880 [Ogataea polymorpha]KAG7924750.1 hypothetical protein KL925_004923 [Ogataea polymorpha]
MNGSRWADPLTVDIFILTFKTLQESWHPSQPTQEKNIQLLELHTGHALIRARSVMEYITADMGSPALAELNWPFDFTRNLWLPPL